MNLTIAILSYDNPRYAFTTISAAMLARSEWRDEGYNCKIEVYVDGRDKEMRKQHDDLFDGLAIDDIQYSPELLGKRGNAMRAWSWAFQNGADEVMLLLDDILIKPDSLAWLSKVPRMSFFYRLENLAADAVDPQSPEDREGVRYDPCGVGSHAVMFNVAAWEMIWHWHESGYAWGQKHPVMPVRVYENRYMGIDTFLSTCAVKNELLCVAPALNRCACYGIRGIENKDLVKETEARMFRGHKDEWLGNVAEILKQGDYDAELDSKLFPRYFDYWGRL
jgi:hypothetical protein